ncbi:MAG: hypothetical protein QF745_02200, partial [Planctomycetota bacterium]|nr:hypothetical protein [Planctomycetota bacterium]
MQYFVEFYDNLPKQFPTDSKNEMIIEEKPESEQLFKGMRIVMTNFRDPKIKEFIETNGGDISKSF